MIKIFLCLIFFLSPVLWGQISAETPEIKTIISEDFPKTSTASVPSFDNPKVLVSQDTLSAASPDSSENLPRNFSDSSTGLSPISVDTAPPLPQKEDQTIKTKLPNPPPIRTKQTPLIGNYTIHPDWLDLLRGTFSGTAGVGQSPANLNPAVNTILKFLGKNPIALDTFSRLDLAARAFQAARVKVLKLGDLQPKFIEGLLNQHIPLLVLTQYRKKRFLPSTNAYANSLRETSLFSRLIYDVVIAGYGSRLDNRTVTSTAGQGEGLDTIEITLGMASGGFFQFPSRATLNTYWAPAFGFKRIQSNQPELKIHGAWLVIPGTIEVDSLLTQVDLTDYGSLDPAYTFPRLKQIKPAVIKKKQNIWFRSYQFIGLQTGIGYREISDFGLTPSWTLDGNASGGAHINLLWFYQLSPHSALGAMVGFYQSNHIGWESEKSNPFTNQPLPAKLFLTMQHFEFFPGVRLSYPLAPASHPLSPRFFYQLGMGFSFTNNTVSGQFSKTTLTSPGLSSGIGIEIYDKVDFNVTFHYLYFDAGELETISFNLGAHFKITNP